jgi:hypothetical protein
MLMQETLDELKVTHPKMLEYKENLTKSAEWIIDNVADTKVIQTSLYFQNLANKVDTVIRKELDVNM